MHFVDRTLRPSKVGKRIYRVAVSWTLGPLDALFRLVEQVNQLLARLSLITRAPFVHSLAMDSSGQGDSIGCHWSWTWLQMTA